MICVVCKKPIAGEPHNSEPWVGAWCSEECERVLDEARSKPKGEKVQDIEGALLEANWYARKEK